jgi:hypothetical protein
MPLTYHNNKMSNLKTDPDEVFSFLLRNIDDESGSKIIQNFQRNCVLPKIGHFESFDSVKDIFNTIMTFVNFVFSKSFITLLSYEIN